MKTGDTKYFHTKQIKKNGKVIGYLTMIGRQYGFIVQLHFFDKPGYEINQTFCTEHEAEKFYTKTFKDVTNRV